MKVIVCSFFRTKNCTEIAPRQQLFALRGSFDNQKAFIDTNNTVVHHPNFSPKSNKEFNLWLYAFSTYEALFINVFLWMYCSYKQIQRSSFITSYSCVQLIKDKQINAIVSIVYLCRYYIHMQYVYLVFLLSIPVLMFHNYIKSTI